MSNYNKNAVRKWQKANPDKVKECLKKWKDENPEKLNAIDARYRASHREEARERSRTWRKEHTDRAKATHKKYYESHKETCNKQSKRWRENNPKKAQELSKQWLKTPKGRMVRHARVDKRRRNMGSNLLNSWFERSNRHHITKNDIICIPKDLHMSIKHNHKRPETMNKINIFAWDYMESSVL